MEHVVIVCLNFNASHEKYIFGLSLEEIIDDAVDILSVCFYFFILLIFITIFKFLIFFILVSLQPFGFYFCQAPLHPFFFLCMFLWVTF